MRLAYLISKCFVDEKMTPIEKRDAIDVVKPYIATALPIEAG